MTGVTRTRWLALPVAAVVVLALLAARSVMGGAPLGILQPRARGQPATVVRWLDADTLQARVDGRVETVRLIGVEAPETTLTRRAEFQAASARVPVREIIKLGLESRSAASMLAPPGAAVSLETDTQKRDRQGRLLAYVWLRDGTMLNERLLREGRVVVLRMPPNRRYADRLEAARNEARARKAGVWAVIRPRGQGSRGTR